MQMRLSSEMASFFQSFRVIYNVQHFIQSVIILQAKGSRNQYILGQQSLPTVPEDFNAYDARIEAPSA